MAAISSDFKSGVQQDAQEFLRCLLDKLDEDSIAPRSSEESSSTEEGSVVKEIFRGCLKSQVCSVDPDNLKCFVIECLYICILTFPYFYLVAMPRVQSLLR